VRGLLDDRAYAIELRRGLLILLRAIEQRYSLGRPEERQAVPSGPRKAASPGK
jgi:hypothetical protein